MTAVTKEIEPATDVAIVTGHAAVTPADMLNHALTNGAAVDVVNQLMTLHERWEAAQARKAFDNAIADAKADIPPIIRTASVGYENKDGSFTGYKHETLGGIARIVDPILSAHGLSYRFRSSQESGQLTVTCIVAHRGGYFEETSLSGPPDHSGKKNAYQAVGSAATYLQRYTLKLALGLSAAHDDDARGALSGKDEEPQQRQEQRQASASKNNDARSIYKAHAANIRSARTLDDLREAWRGALTDKDRIPLDWQKSLVEEKTAKLKEIESEGAGRQASEARQADAIRAPEDPDAFLEFLDGRMKEARDEDGVIAVWHEMSPEDGLDFPPDLARAREIYARARARFGGRR